MLTGSPKKNPHLFQKTEIVALINTFGRISESIAAVERFRLLYQRWQSLAAKPGFKGLALDMLSSTRDSFVKRSVAWADLLCERIPVLKFYRQMLQKTFMPMGL